MLSLFMVSADKQYLKIYNSDLGIRVLILKCRTFRFQFNDLLLVADRNASRLSTKYKVKHIIDITNAQVGNLIIS